MKSSFTEQFIPLVLTIATFVGLTTLLYGFLSFLNLFPGQDVLLKLHLRDIVVGLTIYLKTSVDFAIFIGNLMRENIGWKKRIAIEFGTALGNAMGTLFILSIWDFFKDVPLLMVIMIVLASFVLLRMAEESFEELAPKIPTTIKRTFYSASSVLRAINKTTNPLLHQIAPRVKITKTGPLSWTRLTLFACTIPFILGLDDFAGYIPLFSIINVFGFATGVFLGHMLLNITLFLSPQKTTALVKTPLILLVGGLAFIGIAFWGLYEASWLLFKIFFHWA